jgi:uncharacterized protein YlzI (FlbEa/FlbD family)
MQSSKLKINPPAGGQKYQIDQSGKIEQTRKSTVVTISNGKALIVKVSASEKRKLIYSLKAIRKPNKTYIYDIFASLVYTLLNNAYATDVEIDVEYPGHESSIKERLIQFFVKSNSKPPRIRFGLVGKKCQAHILGLSVFRKETKADMVVKAEDLLEVILGNKKGWRPRPRRGNP